MKFSEMPYKRIDMEEVEKEYKSIIERTKNAKSGEEQMPRKLSDRLQWGRERRQEHNMQQKKNKIKHKEMEL